MEKERLQQLAKKLNLTSSDLEPEPYILTTEEEQAAVDHAVTQEKKLMAWKLADKSGGIALSEGEILLRIAQTNFFERVDWQKVLEKANTAKNYDIWQKEQRRKDREAEIAKQVETKKTWTAKKIYSLMAWTSKNEYGKDLIVHDDNIKLITTICFFLSGDERFETELGYSFNKGLCIRGISGLGKTHLVRCVAENELRPVDVVSLIEITDIVKETGEYKPPLRINRVLYLDDVGTEEPVVKFFGTNISFFKNFIETYYLNNKEYNRLIISTNNSFKEIEDKYGFRVRSRFKDMFNTIDVNGKDMRG